MRVETIEQVLGRMFDISLMDAKAKHLIAATDLAAKIMGADEAQLALREAITLVAQRVRERDKVLQQS